MPSDKPALSVATGFNGGVSVGIHADSWAEFVELCRDVYGSEAGPDTAEGLYAYLAAQAKAGTAALEQSAVALIQGTLGGQPVSPLAPFNSAPAAGGPPPGQTCDPRDPTKTKWVPGGFSQKTQKEYKGFWAKP